MAVLAATLPGMPLIYGGQESGLDKRIEFFEKDPVQWKTYAYAPFYAGLLKLKHGNPALWNGHYGGDIQVLDTGNDKVFAFRRTRHGKYQGRVTAVAYFSCKHATAVT
jgi:glycosidase